jgi:hypothetical protein
MDESGGNRLSRPRRDWQTTWVQRRSALWVIPLMVLEAAVGRATPPAAVAASAQGSVPMTKLSVPGDPVSRAVFLESAKPSHLAAAYQTLLAGHTDAFAVVATWVLAGRPLPAATAADSPTARFFRELFEKTPAAERDAFLQLGLRGQLANPGILARSPRVPLVADAASAARIVRYLAAFPAPAAAPTPSALLGEQLERFATYPDPRMVRLAGALALREALPHLLRFLLLRRRFYQLHTDYTTHPEPTDALFVESLRAVVEIGERGAAADAAAVLLQVRAQAEKELGAGMGTAGQPLGPTLGPAQGEPIVLETYDDKGGQAPPSRDARETRLPKDEKVRDKVAWLTIAQAALQGAPGPRAQLHESAPERPRPALPDAVWTVPSDSAQAAVSRTHLYLVTHLVVGKRHRPVLWSLELLTGRTQFVVTLGPYGSDELELAETKLLVDPDGAPVLLAMLRTADRAESARLYRFAPDTGEISATYRLAVTNRQTPVALAAEADGYVLRRGPVVFRQRRDGTLAWRWDGLAETAVAVGEGTSVALLGKQVLLRREAGERTLSVQSLLGRPKLDESAFPLALADGFAIADPSTKRLYAFDLGGTSRGDWPLAEGARSFSALEGPLAHRAVLARDQLQVLDPSGTLRTLAAPLNVSKVLVTATAAYLGSERALSETPFSGSASRRLPDGGHPHMARVLAATADWIVVQTYADGYQVTALRRQPK